MKKLLALLLLMVMIASLSACGSAGNNNSDTLSSSEAVAETAPETQVKYPVTGNTVYFMDTLFWANGGKIIYVDYWSSSNPDMVEWPGKPMNYLGDSVYSFELPEGVEFMVFNNNSDKNTQTRDIVYDSSVRFFKPTIETDTVGAHFVKDWDDIQVKTNDIDGGKGY